MTATQLEPPGTRGRPAPPPPEGGWLKRLIGYCLRHRRDLIGAFAATWRTATAVIPPGWTLFVHTDGLTDTVGAGRERFGERRLQACFDDPDPERLLNCVRQATDDFRVGPRSDDCTATGSGRRRPCT